MKRVSICYTTKKPVIFNKGTDYERQHSNFLFEHFFGDENQIQERIDNLNQMLADGVAQYKGEDLTQIAKFYQSKYEEMY